MVRVESETVHYRREHVLTPIGGVVPYRIRQSGEFDECFLQSLSQLEFLIWCHRVAALGDTVEFQVVPSDDDPLNPAPLLVRGRVSELHGRRAGRNGYGCEVLSVVECN